MKEFQRGLKGFPAAVVYKMLKRQVEQGNERDVSVFENNIYTSRIRGGFSWDNSVEGYDFWYAVIRHKKFGLFFERYPKIRVIDEAMKLLELYKSRQPICSKEFEYNSKFIMGCDPLHDSTDNCFVQVAKSGSGEDLTYHYRFKNKSGEYVGWNAEIDKAKIIYAEGKEVIFDMEDIKLEKGVLIIKAK